VNEPSAVEQPLRYVARDDDDDPEVVVERRRVRAGGRRGRLGARERDRVRRSRRAEGAVAHGRR
jgi:hypothetical protein